MIAKLAEPMPIDLAESPDLQRGTTLIAVLLVKHAVERAAEQRGGIAAAADQHVGKALEPGQHGHQARPYGVVEIFCLQILFRR
jgi:hypothetical protein